MKQKIEFSIGTFGHKDECECVCVFAHILINVFNFTTFKLAQNS